jgi:hypothetical protein
MSAASLPSLADDGTGTVTFGIQPTPTSNSDQRAAFSFNATPGASVQDSVQVSNFSNQPLMLHMYASDAINTPEGGYDLLPSDQAPRDVGTWVKFQDPKPFQTIPPKSHVIFKFNLVVPATATPGDHAGGIVAAYTTASTDSHGNRVNVEQRVGSRIYLRVQGLLRASLAINKAAVTYHGTWNPFGSGSATVTYLVTNTGNVRLIGKQSVHLTDMFGGSVNADALADLQQLLPGNTLRVTTTAHGVTPGFNIDARISVDPAAMPGDLDPKVDPVTGSASTTAIPWVDILGVLLIAGLGFLFLWRRRGARTPLVPAQPARPASMAEKAAVRSTAMKTTAPKPAVAKSTAKPKADPAVPADKPSDSAAESAPEPVK